MSLYLSSIFIDPVIRQARRFSRNNSEPSQSTIRRVSRYDTNARTLQQDGAVVDTISEGDRTDPATNSPETVVNTTDGRRAIASGSEGGLVAELQIWSDVQGPVSPLRRAESNPDVYNRTRATGHQVRQIHDDTSSNPMYGIPTNLRSMGSSVSSSRRSLGDIDARSGEGSSRLSSTRMIEHGAGDSGSYDERTGDGCLPADDGMGHMRRKILAIQKMEASSAEKARLIHGLMTEQYVSSQTALHVPSFPRTHSPASLMSQERPFTPISSHSMDNITQAASPPTSLSSFADLADPFRLTADDLKPTYYSKKLDGPPASREETKGHDEANEPSESADEVKPLGCAHYKRNIKLQCSACNRWYTCRFCHDEVEDHSLNRRETKNMLCMLCGCAQSASEVCIQCGERGAWYYCNVCKLWDDDSKKSIYHCDDCGICRVGQGLGKDFYHCKVILVFQRTRFTFRHTDHTDQTCCVCLSISIRDRHRCIERSMDCDCPICGEYMFTSPSTVVFMRCGHSIHQRCYYEHMNTSYRCPICSRSVVNMEMQFRHLERAIESQPMPPQFQDTKALISCNDCSAKTTVKYHWLGLKCAVLVVADVLALVYHLLV